jgi:hypothetical protein
VSDLSMVLWVAAKHCPATPTHPLPRLRGFGPAVYDAVHRKDRWADGGWVEALLEAAREHDRRMVEEQMMAEVRRLEWAASGPHLSLENVISFGR